VPGGRGQGGDPRLERRLQAPVQRQPLGQRAGVGALQAGERHRQLKQGQRVTLRLGQQTLTDPRRQRGKTVLDQLGGGSSAERRHLVHRQPAPVEEAVLS
jgi:hypothetical protein